MRVLIVDDHKLFAEAIRPTLVESGIEVLELAQTGERALEMATEYKPDLVLLDMGLPDIPGLEVGRKIHEELPETKLIAVTALNDPDLVRETIASGFHGYVTKDTPLSQFIASIDFVLAGQTVLPQRLSPRAAGARTDEEKEAALRARYLTFREREVLRLLAEGASSAEIARRLSVSMNTVRSHVQNILSKLQVHSRLEAAAFAVRYGIVNAPGQQDD
ncbi:MAG: response regulator [Actinomycetota bacterium]